MYYIANVMLMMRSEAGTENSNEASGDKKAQMRLVVPFGESFPPAAVTVPNRSSTVADGGDVPQSVRL